MEVYKESLPASWNLPKQSWNVEQKLDEKKDMKHSLKLHWNDMGKMILDQPNL